LLLAFLPCGSSAFCFFRNYSLSKVLLGSACFCHFSVVKVVFLSFAQSQ
jgi:hypothetical protein